MTKLFGMEYSVAVVPTFDRSGRPDLLGWDDAMDSHENDVDIWATFHDDEAADLCEPVLRDLFKSREDAAREECDEPVFICESVTPTTAEKLDIEYFWQDILDVGNGFDADEFGWSDTDNSGKEYAWNEDSLEKQVPKAEDYLSVAMNDLRSELEFAFNPYDISPSEAEAFALEKFQNILRLGIQLYRKEEDYYVY